MPSDCLTALFEAHSQQTPVVWTALVQTRGSTPQKAGATMLVFADGSQVGTLGGGCVEAEVKRKALQNLQTGNREIVTFQLDNNYGWDDGLICGGRMTMLIDPIQPDDSLDYFETIAQLKQSGQSYTQAILIDSPDENESTAGNCYLVDTNQKIVAQRADNEAPGQLLDHVKPLEERPRPYVKNKISYLPALDRCRLLIV